MLRAALRTTALSIGLIAAPLTATAASFTGTWHGALAINGQRCTIEVTLAPNGSYVQTARCGIVMTQQSGTYKIFPNNQIGFTVINWAPRQRYVVGAQVGSGHFENNAKPPGGLFKITFTGSDTMVWRDLDYGGTISLQRT